MTAILPQASRHQSHRDMSVNAVVEQNDQPRASLPRTNMRSPDADSAGTLAALATINREYTKFCLASDTRPECIEDDHDHNGCSRSEASELQVKTISGEIMASGDIQRRRRGRMRPVQDVFDAMREPSSHGTLRGQ